MEHKERARFIARIQELELELTNMKRKLYQTKYDWMTAAAKSDREERTPYIVALIDEILENEE